MCLPGPPPAAAATFDWVRLPGLGQTTQFDSEELRLGGAAGKSGYHDFNESAESAATGAGPFELAARPHLRIMKLARASG
jgi:hypothetical protein